MKTIIEPKKVAEDTCRILETSFPELEISHHDPNTFFDGFFTECGYPATPDFFPIWGTGKTSGLYS